HREREGGAAREREDPHRFLGGVRRGGDVVRSEDGVPGRDREAFRALGFGGERPAEEDTPNACEDPPGVARWQHRGLGRHVVPLGPTKLASRRNDANVAVARSSTLLRDELFQARKIRALRVRVHLYERRRQPLNSVSTKGPAASTTAQSLATGRRNGSDNRRRARS